MDRLPRDVLWLVLREVVVNEAEWFGLGSAPRDKRVARITDPTFNIRACFNHDGTLIDHAMFSWSLHR